MVGSRFERMPCALCLQEKSLRLSHIVPEFMYAAMYDGKHRFFGISSIPTKRNKFFQKGLRERLLCSDCEQHIGKYEHYASGVFYGHTVRKTSRVAQGYLLEGLDYAKLKIFFLSLLWRFAMTTVEQYRRADLGPYTEKLRQLILSDDPGDYLKYPCMVTAIIIDGKHMADLIAPPADTRLEGQRIWNIVVAGFVFSFFLGKTATPSTLRAGFLRENGTLFVQVRDIHEIDYLYRFLCEMGAAERKRKRQDRDRRSN